MSKFTVLILGSASASPTLKRNPTAQLVNINEQYFLIDCGEGTQLRLRENKIKFQRIHHIFISHLHGDHYFGLMGLLQSMHLLGRTAELNIYGHAALKEIIDLQLKSGNSYLSYPLVFNELNKESSEIILDNSKIEVSTVILNHRIPCSGFIFKEKSKPRKINPAAIQKYKIPRYAITALKSGADYTKENGDIIKNELLTSHPLPSFSYAFCSDTRFSEKIIPQIKGVNLLYHEATFTDEHLDRAKKTYHSTAKQAALIALKAKVNQLIIGHFSNRYLVLDELLNEAKSVFENTELAEENILFDVSKTQETQC